MAAANGVLVRVEGGHRGIWVFVLPMSQRPPLTMVGGLRRHALPLITPGRPGEKAQPFAGPINVQVLGEKLLPWSAAVTRPSDMSAESQCVDRLSMAGIRCRRGCNTAISSPVFGRCFCVLVSRETLDYKISPARRRLHTAHKILYSCGSFCGNVAFQNKSRLIKC